MIGLDCDKPLSSTPAASAVCSHPILRIFRFLACWKL